MSKIAKIQLVRLTNRWGGYKVREVTEGGRVILSSGPFHYWDEAKALARRRADFHHVKLEIV